MRQRKIDNSVEKSIATGAIVSTEYLKAVQAIYHADLVAVPFVKTVLSWCLDYYRQYERAPERYIADIFAASQRNGLADDQAELIADFLTGLSDEFEHSEAGKFNVQYCLDASEKHFEARNQELLVADIRALHAKSAYAEAEQLIAGYKRVQLPAGAGIEPFTDADAIRKAFDPDSRQELFRLPGALGELVGAVEREDFIGILAPEKRGKSWRLLDLAVRGLRAGCNVAYFDAGDMNQDQVVRRLHARNTQRSPKYGGPMLTPVLDCRHSQEDTCRRPQRISRRGVCEDGRDKTGALIRVKMAFADVSGYQPCSACVRDNPADFQGAVWYAMVDSEQLTWQHAVELGQRTAARSRKRFKLSCHANSTLTVAGMEAVLDRWRAEDGFVADLVFADYFDIFAAENPKTVDPRHRINETWQAGRRFTQQQHCALITVTQADANSYDRRSLKLSNFSEDKRKFAHTTKFWVLNQTAEEKRDMIIRMATLLMREDEFDVDREVVIAQDLRRGQPYVFSYFAHKVL